MRILHTADWHLGRSFHRASLLSVQEQFMDHLVEVVRSENIDAVVVSGDIYDRALPSVDVVSLLDDGLSRLAATGATIVMISGNHDSAHRLGFAAGLLQRSGVHVRTAVARAGEPVMLTDAHGPVAIYAIPYLEPAAVATELGSPATHQAVLGSAMNAVTADLAARRAANSQPLRSVAMAHAFVVGGEASDSERDVSVGGVATVAAQTFADIDYVALGHLHRPQQVTAPGQHLYYSGSPIAYSFSEAGQQKSSLMVTLDAAGVQEVTSIATPVARPLAILRGDLDELLRRDDMAIHEKSWCQVSLTDEHRPAQAMGRLQARFPHTVEVRFAPRGDAQHDTSSYTQKVRGRDDIQICQAFLEHVRGRPAAVEEVTLLREAVLAQRLHEAEIPVTTPASTVGRPRSGEVSENIDVTSDIKVSAGVDGESAAPDGAIATMPTAGGVETLAAGGQLVTLAASAAIDPADSATASRCTGPRHSAKKTRRRQQDSPSQTVVQLPLDGV